MIQARAFESNPHTVQPSRIVCFTISSSGRESTGRGDGVREEARADSSRSPRARSAREGGTAPTNTATSGIHKEIELDGLSAYTKNSTEDWWHRDNLVEQHPGGGLDGADGRSTGGRERRPFRPTPPGQRNRFSSRTSEPSEAAGEPARGGQDINSTPEVEASDSTTEAVFLLRPVTARGTLAFHLDGGAAQAVAPTSSASDTGRPPTGPQQGADNIDGANASSKRSMAAEQSGDHANGHNGGEHGTRAPPSMAAASFNIEAIAVQVDARQYDILNRAVSAVAMSKRRFHFRRERPTTPVLEDPAAWWRYAAK